MKKRLLILALFLLLCITGALCYRSYFISRTDKYIKSLEIRMKFPPLGFNVENEIQVDRIIKRTPSRLEMIIKWGENEKAYVSAKNWLTRAHDYIEIYPFDMKKIRIIIE